MASPLQAQWLFHYLNQGTNTFFNAAESARAAEYKCDNEENFKKVGWKNKKVFEPQISEWLEENGLSDNALKGKLVQLLEDPLSSIQIKALDMGFKMRGLYAPTESKLKISPDLEEKAAVNFFSKVMGVTEAGESDGS